MGRFLRINLLGSYQAALDGGEPLSYATSKVQALLAYLVMEPRVHERSRLAGLLWPDVSERAARNNLRQTLFRLRRTLDDADDSAQFLQVSRQTVVWAPAGPVELDVERFLDGLQGCGQHTGRSQASCPVCITMLATAAQHYQGDFLTDLYVDDSDLFAEWVEMQRSWLRRQALGCLDQLSSWYGRQAQFDLAIQYARRQTVLDPFYETGQQQLIRWLAYDGQLGAALAQARAFVAELRQELGSDPTAETTALIQQLQAGTLQSTLPPNSHAPLPVTATTSPQSFAPVTPLVGRAEELQALAEWLRGSNGRPLVLHGPPGVGKTALARALLGQVAQADHRPVCQLDTEQVKKLSDGMAADLEAVPPGALVLLDAADNLHEQALQKAAQLLGARCGQLLITGRRRLDLPDARTWLVEPLALGESAQKSAAAALFWHFADQPMVRPVPAGELEQVWQLCTLLEGYPLAIKLAAQWHRLLSIPELLLEVKSDPFLLGASSAEAGPLLRRFIDHWDSLTAEYQRTIQLLSLFPGPISRQGARAVAAVELPELDSLTAAGILRREKGGAYRLNRLWRCFLRRLPAVATATDGGQARFVAHYVVFLERHLPALRSGQQLEALSQLKGERANLARAWQWAVASQNEAALTCLVEGLGHYCDMAGELDAGRQALRDVLARLPGLSAAVEAQLLEWKGWFCYQLGELAAAYQLMARVTSQFPADSPYAARARVRLAIVAAALGDEELAGEAARLSLARAEALGDWPTAAMALSVTGNVFLRQGDSDVAETLLQKSLALSRMVGDRWGMSFALSALARLWQAKGDSAVAVRFLEDSFALRSQLGDHRRAARVLNRLGRFVRQQGELLLAEKAYERAIRYCRHHELTVELTAAMMGLAETARVRGHFAAALSQLQAALQLAVNGQRQPQIVEILFTFTHLLAEIQAQPEPVAATSWDITPGSDVLAHFFMTQTQATGQPMSREQISQMVALFFTQNPYELSQL